MRSFPYDALIVSKVYLLLERLHLINITDQTVLQKSTISPSLLDCCDTSFDKIEEDKIELKTLSVTCHLCNRTSADRVAKRRCGTDIICFNCVKQKEWDNKIYCEVSIKEAMEQSSSAVISAINKSGKSFKEMKQLLEQTVKNNDFKKVEGDFKKLKEAFIEFPLRESIVEDCGQMLEKRNKKEEKSINYFGNLLTFVKDKCCFERNHLGSEKKIRNTDMKDCLIAVQAAGLTANLLGLRRKRQQMVKEMNEIKVSHISI